MFLLRAQCFSVLKVQFALLGPEQAYIYDMVGVWPVLLLQQPVSHGNNIKEHLVWM